MSLTQRRILWAQSQTWHLAKVPTVLLCLSNVSFSISHIYHSLYFFSAHPESYNTPPSSFWPFSYLPRTLCRIKLIPFIYGHQGELLPSYMQFTLIFRHCKFVPLPLVSQLIKLFIQATYYLGMTNQLQHVQRYFTRRLDYRCQLDCNHDYPERLTKLNLESLEIRPILLDLTMV